MACTVLCTVYLKGLQHIIVAISKSSINHVRLASLHSNRRSTSVRLRMTSNRVSQLVHRPYAPRLGAMNLSFVPDHALPTRRSIKCNAYYTWKQNPHSVWHAGADPHGTKTPWVHACARAKVSGSKRPRLLIHLPAETLQLPKRPIQPAYAVECKAYAFWNLSHTTVTPQHLSDNHETLSA